MHTRGWIDGRWPRARAPSRRRGGDRAAARRTPPATAGNGGGTPRSAQTPSLYDRLGGIFAIAAVVDRFSDEIIKNPKLNENPALKAWNETEAAARLPGLKFGRTLWIAAMAGGPYRVHRLAAGGRPPGSQPHGRGIRGGRRGDRPRARVLRGAGTRNQELVGPTGPAWTRW